MFEMVQAGSAVLLPDALFPGLQVQWWPTAGLSQPILKQTIARSIKMVGTYYLAKLGEKMACRPWLLMNLLLRSWISSIYDIYIRIAGKDPI